MINNKLFTLLTTAVMLFMFGLQANAQKSVELKYNVDQGDAYHYVMDIDQDIMFDANGQTMTMDNTTTFEVTSLVSKTYSDSIRLDVTIDRVKMKQSVFGMEINYDTDDPATAQNPMAAQLSQTFGAMIGKSYVQVMDLQGNILRTDMHQLSGNDDFANNLSSGAQFGNYPDHPVSVGDSWEKDITPLKGSDMKVHAKYTLVKLSGKQATISFEGTLTANNVQDIDMKLNGTQKGEMIIDTKTGWLVESNIDQELSMDLDQNGQKIPATISGTIKTTASKK